MAPEGWSDVGAPAAASLTGRRFGAYVVGEPLESGGMGDVYHGHDTQLGRKVAIKVVRAAFARDPERMARFEREARLLAALDHPHIGTIYGVEESDGTRAIIMAFVEGDTVADRLRRGPIPVLEALEYARQVAEGLEAAHEKGIVHRDLKPANIKVTPTGVVKVLDFGLAKTLDAPSANSKAATETADETRTGVVMGTPAYMSPEQTRGEAVDRRTDIWAFGCVLYEMLTGRTPFGGRTVADIRAAILHAEPDWSALPREASEPVRRLLRRTLAKNRRDRLADTSAIRLELADAAQGKAADRNASVASAPPDGTLVRRLVLAAGITAAVVLAAAVGYWLRPAPAERSLSFSILPPDGVSFAGAAWGAPALSPDGRSIAFVTEGPAARLLWVQSVDAFDARSLPGTDGAFGPFWSPDGRWLAFFADGALKKIPLTGGQPQVLSPAQVSMSLSTGAWNPDGTILFYGPGNTLYTVPAAGGETTPATSRNIDRFDENHYHPAFLPDGRHYLLLVRGGAELEYHLSIGQLGSNDRRLLLTGVTNAQYAPPRETSRGHLLFVRDGTLLAQPFGVDTLALSGNSVTVAGGVAMNGSGSIGDFSVSPSGVLAYRRAAAPSGPELVWYDRAGKQVGAIGSRPGNAMGNLRLSPDGTWAAFTRREGGVTDVWLAKISSGETSRFTFNGGRTPVWSPDGASVAFQRQDTIYRKSVRGGEEVAVWSGPGIMSVNDWSGDGKYLLLTRWDASAGMAGRGVWLLSDPTAKPGDREPVLFESGGLHPQFVPANGRPRWVSYDAGEVFLRAMPGEPPGKWQVSTDGGNGTRWRRDGREVFFSSSRYASLVGVEVDSSLDFRRTALRPLFMLPRAIATAIGQYGLGYDVTANGERFLTTFPRPDTPSPAIHIVTNWQSMLPN